MALFGVLFPLLLHVFKNQKISLQGNADYINATGPSKS